MKIFPKQPKYILIYILILFLFFETVAFFTVTYLASKGIFYIPPHITKIEYDEYLCNRNPAFGWPGSGSLTSAKGYDASGSRLIPAFPDPDKYPAAVSLYGDSFTYGFDVESEYAYGNVLARLIQRRVANYGVGGYGTDQAFLRFMDNNNDQAKIVILGYWSENILRNINRYRYLFHTVKTKLGFKPRFIIRENHFVQIPLISTPSYEEFEKIIKWPEKYLTDEYFLPGGPTGNLKPSFPYTLSIFKAFKNNIHIRAAFKREPWYLNFYKPEHPSQALAVTESIITQFVQEAVKRQKTPIILIIPAKEDIIYYQRHKVWPYRNLVERLRQKKVFFIDAGQEIATYLKGRSPYEIFSRRHFTIKGYALLASLVYAHIKDMVLELETKETSR